MAPKYGLLFDDQERTAIWLWKAFNLFPMPYNMMIGILDRDQDNRLVGAIYFDQWNGYNIELSYYGPGTPTYGICKSLAVVALRCFNVQRVSMRTPNTNGRLVKGLRKIGFEIESIESHMYGPERHAVRLVIFRKGLERIANPVETVELIEQKQESPRAYLN